MNTVWVHNKRFHWHWSGFEQHLHVAAAVWWVEDSFCSTGTDDFVQENGKVISVLSRLLAWETQNNNNGPIHTLAMREFILAPSIRCISIIFQDPNPIGIYITAHDYTQLFMWISTRSRTTRPFCSSFQGPNHAFNHLCSLFSCWSVICRLLRLCTSHHPPLTHPAADLETGTYNTFLIMFPHDGFCGILVALLSQTHSQSISHQ